MEFELPALLDELGYVRKCSQCGYGGKVTHRIQTPYGLAYLCTGCAVYYAEMMAADLKSSDSIKSKYAAVWVITITTDKHSTPARFTDFTTMLENLIKAMQAAENLTRNGVTTTISLIQEIILPDKSAVTLRHF